MLYAKRGSLQGLILSLIGTLIISSDLLGNEFIKKIDTKTYQLFEKVSGEKKWKGRPKTKKVRRIILTIFFYSVLVFLYIIYKNFKYIPVTIVLLLEKIIIGYVGIWAFLIVLGLLLKKFIKPYDLKIRSFTYKHRKENQILSIILFLPLMITISIILIIFLTILSIPIRTYY